MVERLTKTAFHTAVFDLMMIELKIVYRLGLNWKNIFLNNFPFQDSNNEILPA